MKWNFRLGTERRRSSSIKFKRKQGMATAEFLKDVTSGGRDGEEHSEGPSEEAQKRRFL